MQIRFWRRFPTTLCMRFCLTAKFRISPPLVYAFCFFTSYRARGQAKNADRRNKEKKKKKAAAKNEPAYLVHKRSESSALLK